MAAAVDSGPTDVPLLDETIPENPARTVAAFSDREAAATPSCWRWMRIKRGQLPKR